ncbi:MAG: HigA family addiction module antidote protein [Gammaproteobacteria bacterium]|nr:HigA family addiction module antidote protein [Gammaproteobacteria bacterium]
MKMHNPPHPGKVLYGLYLEPMGLTISETAKALSMPRSALSEIVNGKRAISPKVAIKLGKAFSCNSETWLRMQTKYELWQAEQTYQAEDVSKLFHADRVTA